MSTIIAKAITEELDRFGTNPDYSDFANTEYACDCVFSNRERKQIFPMSAEEQTLRRVQHLYRLLCEGSVSANYYRKVLRSLKNSL